MSLDEMKELWKSQEAPAEDRVDADVLAGVRRAAAELDRQVRRRDWIETGVGVLVSALFLPLLWNPSWVVRSGVLLYMAGTVLTYVKLRGARRAEGPADPTAPLMDTIRRERRKVAAQMRLLESVMWWYVVPLSLAAILVFGGLTGPTLLTALYTAVVAAFGVQILRWNRNAVRRDLRPRYDELTRLLEEAEG